jgi:HEAT repeat protein
MADLPALISALTSGDDERAEAATLKLATLGERVLPALLLLLDDADADTRWWAVRVLAELNIPQVPSLLQSALEDSDTKVRQCAALALRQQPSPDAVKDLIAMLEDDDRLLARLAADALIANGKQAVQPLLETLEDSSPAARLEAVRSLAVIADPIAIPALYKALDADSVLITHWAELGLERMGVGMVFFYPS